MRLKRAIPRGTWAEDMLESAALWTLDHKWPYWTVRLLHFLAHRRLMHGEGYCSRCSIG